jgi:hypothetical protein
LFNRKLPVSHRLVAFGALGAHHIHSPTSLALALS